ncbi:Translin family protein [Phaffia rhodozyma]|uniref:Translin family protein n=1 Tax=Phaffia rhodozyma TaxID=264483 RepID=A0A0F7SLW3_PHARH|nr:Translin family protein [Phaffia rhodozyma]
MDSSLETVLLQVNENLERESVLREQIKDSVKLLDRQVRIVLSLVNKVHATTQENLSTLADQVNQTLVETQPLLSGLAQLIPAHEFFKWQSLITRPLQSLVFAAALAHFILHERLIEIDQVGLILGIDPSWSDRLALLPEEYLHGVISLVNELSRLAVNSVTMGNYAYPLKISTFVGELFAGYQLLNLKNDSLRRRFDSLKYDLKKIEEVVYDISLRGLTKKATTPSTTEL